MYNEKMALLCGKIEICDEKNEVFLFKIEFEHKAEKTHEHAGLQSFLKPLHLFEQISKQNAQKWLEHAGSQGFSKTCRFFNIFDITDFVLKIKNDIKNTFFSYIGHK